MDHKQGDQTHGFQTFYNYLLQTLKAQLYWNVLHCVHGDTTRYVQMPFTYFHGTAHVQVLQFIASNIASAELANVTWHTPAIIISTCNPAHWQLHRSLLHLWTLFCPHDHQITPPAQSSFVI
jgi:hypothetical protein